MKAVASVWVPFGASIIVAVLDNHRALSRSAALAFFAFNVVAAVFLFRIL